MLLSGMQAVGRGGGFPNSSLITHHSSPFHLRVSKYLLLKSLDKYIRIYLYTLLAKLV
ncbi:MAG: hypothetical protein JW749_04340 [Sedimentisphaerales bacterium]|nr:hypothetical protein [Sedimentisphaerales bacterium]